MVTNTNTSLLLMVCRLLVEGRKLSIENIYSRDDEEHDSNHNIHLNYILQNKQRINTEKSD